MDINFEYIDPFDEKYDYLMRVEHLARYFFALDLLKGLNNVLDVACANGYGTKVLSKSISKVTGIDKNSEYLEIARRKHSGENIIYKQADIDKEEIKGEYDGIVCFETLEHLKYPEKFLNNIYSILKKNGTLVLSIPNSKYEIIENGKNLDTYHLHVFELNYLLNVLNKVGFKTKEIYGQSYTNKIVNKEITDYSLTNVVEKDAREVGYPNNEEIEKTYSYIFVLNK